MKALVKRESAPGLQLEDVPEPTIGINDVLIKVDRTGICLSRNVMFLTRWVWSNSRVTYSLIRLLLWSSIKCR